jgi:putative membrane protein
MMGFGYGGMLFGGLMMLAFWVLVIVGIIWLVLTLARGGQMVTRPSAAGPQPLDVLKERYAKGEITKEQYEAMKQDLSA